MAGEQDPGDSARIDTNGAAGSPVADGASQGDLRRGYTVLTERLDDQGRSKAHDPFGIAGGFSLGGDEDDGGFLDRPHGWER